MRDGISISAAFPTLAGGGAFADVLSRVGLGEADDIACLVSHASRREVLDEAVRLLIEFHPARALVESLPAMVAFHDEVISPGTFSVRPFNALRRSNKGQNRTWGDVSRLCPEDLLSFTNLGMRPAVEIVATAALRGLIALDEGSVPYGSSGTLTDSASPSIVDAHYAPPSDVSPSMATDGWPAMRAWNVVVQWLQESSDAKTLIDGLDELRRGGLPSDVASAWDEIEAVRLDEILARPSPDSLAAFMARVDERLGGERVQTIFWSRIVPAPPTLEQVGTGLDVTRERVRQLQSKAEQLVRGLLDEEFARVRWRAAALARQLGSAFPTGAAWADDAIADAAAGVPPEHGERFGSLLLWLAGPYRQYSDGWTRSKDLPRRDLVPVAVSEANVIDETMLVEAVVAEGLAPLAASEWIAQNVPIRVVGEATYLWEGSVADKALILLNAWGEPATAEDITEAIGEGHGVRSTRTRLLDDPRFKRVDRQRIGLRDWEMDEYTGIADELAEEIERRGGSCELAELVSTVASNYNLKPASVEAYTGAPRFVVENRIVRLRRQDEPYVTRHTVMDESRCYLLGKAVCSYRLLVDGEVLRGSGRPIPEGLGAWLGVVPGVRRVISFGEVDIPVTWPDSALLGPSIGSLRRVVEGLRVQAGTWIRLTFDRDRSTGTASVVDLDRLPELPSEEQVAVLTGVQVGPDDLERALGAAVGATGGTGLRERLRQRGEDDLLSLMPSRSAELDEALDRIKELF